MGAVAVEDDLIDDDILEIFVEEAQEVLETINEQFPLWRAEPGNAEIRLEVRRAFHTLKGSGRMVKAVFISELAWSVENMMNRITDGTIAISEPVFELIDQVRDVMPSLIEAFQNRADAPLDVQPMMQCADALARGETVAAMPAATAAATASVALAKSPEPANDIPETVAEAEPALSEEEMQQINDRLDALARQMDSLGQGLATLQARMQGMQSDIGGLQARPSSSLPEGAALQMQEDVASTKSGLKAVQGNLKAAMTRFDGEFAECRAAIKDLNATADVAALRSSLETEVKALRMEHAEACKAANTMVGIAIGVGLLCIGLVLFFHLM
ncbi:MAG: hypothetical protein EP312_09985 [Gammaproteobacteria bacterium]|nr:MAG: hypothetical protein EP312_09985 [Gammaproteobacteria bacterium]